MTSHNTTQTTSRLRTPGLASFQEPRGIETSAPRNQPPQSAPNPGDVSHPPRWGPTHLVRRSQEKSQQPRMYRTSLRLPDAKGNIAGFEHDSRGPAESVQLSRKCQNPAPLSTRRGLIKSAVGRTTSWEIQEIQGGSTYRPTIRPRVPTNRRVGRTLEHLSSV